MIKNLLILGITLVPLNSFLQPIITADNIRPLLNEGFSHSNFDWDGEEVIVGEDVNWDYSSVEATSTSENIVVPLSDSPYDTFYDSTNVCYSSNEGVNFSYNYWNEDEAIYKGSSTTGSYYSIFENPKLVWTFPFSYDSSFTDTFSSIVSADFDYEEVGDVTSTAIGYGTLAIPSGTYDNVLLVKQVANYEVFEDEVMFDSYTMTTFTFFKPGTHTALLSLNSDSEGHISAGSYFENELTSLNEINNTSEISLFPNPSQDQINFNFRNVENIESIKIFTTTGKLVFETTAQIQQLDISSFNAGFYIVQILDGKNEIHKKFMKE